MKRGFLDRVDPPASCLRPLDPRSKLLYFFFAAVVISSEPNRELAAFPAYAALTATLAMAGQVRPVRLAARLVPALPFILMAAALPLASLLFGVGNLADAEAFAASVLFRSSLCVLLLVLLTETTPFDDILWAMRRLRAPESLSVITTLMYRYLYVLFDEWRRVGQARACRTAGRLRLPRLQFYGGQLALIFLRSWERSERVHAAMVLRGFHGSLPVRRDFRLGPADALFALGWLPFLAVRLAL